MPLLIVFCHLSKRILCLDPRFGRMAGMATIKWRKEDIGTRSFAKWLMSEMIRCLRAILSFPSSSGGFWAPTKVLSNLNIWTTISMSIRFGSTVGLRNPVESFFSAWHNRPSWSHRSHENESKVEWNCNLTILRVGVT